MDASSTIRRSKKQNDSLHVWFREYAEELQNAGVEQSLIFDIFNVPISEVLLKEVFKAIAKKQFGKDSTTKLTKMELKEVSETFMRELSERGWFIPFPSIQNATYDDNP